MSRGAPRAAGTGQKRTGSDTVGTDAPVAGLAARMAAARLLAAVIDAHTPLDGMTDSEHGRPQFRGLDHRDQQLVRAIVTTALRFHVTIATLLTRLLERPLPANATTLRHILHVAAAQILFLDVPDSAAVDLAVTHAKGDPRTARFGGLVNGVLRSLARNKAAWLPEVERTVVDAPQWFVDRLDRAYGSERRTAILAMHRLEAPIDFTVKSDPEGWADRLRGIVLPTGTVRVARPFAPIPELPGFRDGEWWIQDAAAALPARLFGRIEGLRVADLCAAPGGKTAQLAMAGARVTAIDSSRSRLARLNANLTRLNLAAEVVNADIFSYEPDAPFDAVLLDAPCSSTGTVRRHPDVLWTKTPADLDTLAALQRRLLDRALTFLRPGGRLVFSNCSLDPSEGEALVADILDGRSDVVCTPIDGDTVPGARSFLTPAGMLRTTPADLKLDDLGMSGLDGFFAALLLKRGAA